MIKELEHLDYWIEHFYKGHNGNGLNLSPIDCGEIMQLLIKLDKAVKRFRIKIL